MRVAQMNLGLSLVNGVICHLLFLLLIAEVRDYLSGHFAGDWKSGQKKFFSGRELTTIGQN